jgi:ribosomal-protein-alanine N-acetyltransferase
MKASTVTGSCSVKLIAPRALHAKMWFAWRSEPQAQRYMPIEPWSVNALKRRLLASTPDLADEEKQEHRWIVQVGAESAGIVSILRPVFLQGYAEISYHLADAYQGQGIGTEAVAQLVDYVFEQTELARLFALISIGNRPSRGLVEKLGFVHEGTLRRHFVVHGKRVDQCVYGLLRKEWKRSR